MSSLFLVPEDQLLQLISTRSGRVSYAGYNYQCGYAVSRLASMVTAKPLLGLADYPRVLRYDWGEDLDEILDDGSVCFTQCKRIEDIGQPAKLANVLLGFAPKWLWTPLDNRDQVRFRVVSCDPRFRPNFNRENIREDVFSHFKKLMNNQPSSASDRALWQASADMMGSEALFNGLWKNLSLVYVDRTVDHTDPAGTILWSEGIARDLLLKYGLATASAQKAAIEDLRCLINNNLIAFDPTSDECPSFQAPVPTTIDAADVRIALLDKKERYRSPQFEIVNQVLLSKVRAQPVHPDDRFLFKPPEWRYVVHGTDSVTKFVERDQTESLRNQIRKALLEPLLRGTSNLPVLFVIGPPGTGKSTLVRRVSAMLVESGEVVVADAGLNLAGGPHDVRSYAEDLQELAGAGRPVLLLLDDPLFEESEWLDLLIQLKQPGFRVATIAATPDFLYQRYRSQLDKLSCNEFWVLPPTPNEKKLFAGMYGRDINTFAKNCDDLLVMTAEAESGEQFTKIMERLWHTLNGGRPFDNNLSFDQLPWEVRAFWFVCFMHRAYVFCPLAVLRAALELSGGTGSGLNVETALTKLKAQSGWSVFRHHTSKRGFADDYISTAHQRIASVAWTQRPLKWLDSRVKEVLAQSTLEEPQTARSVVRAAIVAAKAEADSEMSFISELIKNWQKAEWHQLETLHLCSFIRAFTATYEYKHKVSLRELLQPRTIGKDGWLAALQLWLMSGPDPKSRSFPDEIELGSLIAVADLSLAPAQAREFLQILSASDSKLGNAINQRLFESLEGRTEWELDPQLMIWLLTHVPKEASVTRLSNIIAWLKRHEDNSAVRTRYLAFLKELPAAFKEQRKQAVTDTAEWLKRHEDNSEVRMQYLTFLRGLTNFDDAKKQAATDTAEWLKRHEDSSEVRMQYLTFLKGLTNFEETKKQAATDIAEWLKRHEDNSTVRTQYLAFLKELPVAFKEQRKQAAVETAEWLKRHEENSDVRTQYLAFLKGLASFEEAKKQAVTDTADWLKRHEDNSAVRTQYLAFLKELPAAFKEQRKQAATDIAEWLKRHEDNAEVRIQYLTFLKGLTGFEEVKKQTVTDIAEWLKRHEDNSAVRTQYLTFLKELPAAFDEVREQVATDTAEWLKQHEDNSEVRTQYLAFLKELPAPFKEQRKQAAIETEKWLNRHEENSEVRTQYLAFLKELPAAFEALRKQAALDILAWLKRHDDDFDVRTQYLKFLQGLSAAFDEFRSQAVIDMSDWLKRHDDYASGTVRAQHLTFVQSLGEAFDNERIQIAQETSDWLDRHPDCLVVISAYLSFIFDAQLPQLDPLRESSEKLHHQLLQKESPNRGNYFVYGEHLLRQSRYDEAIVQFDVVIERHKGHQLARRGRALALQGLGRMKEAEAEFKHALWWARFRKARLALFQTSLGEFYLETNLWLNAINFFQDAQKQFPEHYRNHYGIAKAELGLGHFDQAENALQRALEDPNLKSEAKNQILQLLDHVRDRQAE